MHRWQDRGLHGGCAAAAPGRRAGQGAHLPGARHTEGICPASPAATLLCSVVTSLMTRAWQLTWTCWPSLWQFFIRQNAESVQRLQVWADLYGLPVAGCEGKTAAQIFEAAGCTPPAAPSCAACLGGPKDTFARMHEPQVCVSTTNRCVKADCCACSARAGMQRSTIITQHVLCKTSARR